METKKAQEVETYVGTFETGRKVREKLKDGWYVHIMCSVKDYVIVVYEKQIRV